MRGCAARWNQPPRSHPQGLISPLCRPFICLTRGDSSKTALQAYLRASRPSGSQCEDREQPTAIQTAQLRAIAYDKRSTERLCDGEEAGVSYSKNKNAGPCIARSRASLIKPPRQELCALAGGLRYFEDRVVAFVAVSARARYLNGELATDLFTAY